MHVYDNEALPQESGERKKAKRNEDMSDICGDLISKQKGRFPLLYFDNLIDLAIIAIKLSFNSYSCIISAPLKLALLFYE